MPGSASPIELTAAEQSVIDSLIRSPQSRQGQVVRLKLVVLAHEGHSNRSIASRLGMGISAVGK